MNHSKGNTSIMFSGTASGELLQYMLSINLSTCGSQGPPVVQRRHVLTDQKVVGLMQCVLMTGSKLSLFPGPEKKWEKKS